MKGSVNISDYFYGAKTQFIIPSTSVSMHGRKSIVYVYLKI